jgi:hypothetical protein
MAASFNGILVLAAIFGKLHAAGEGKGRNDISPSLFSTAILDN